MAKLVWAIILNTIGFPVCFLMVRLFRGFLPTVSIRISRDCHRVVSLPYVTGLFRGSLRVSQAFLVHCLAHTEHSNIIG